MRETENLLGHSFMETRRKYMTLASEAEDLTIHDTASSINIGPFVLVPLVSRSQEVTQMALYWMPAHALGFITGG